MNRKVCVFSLLLGFVLCYNTLSAQFMQGRPEGLERDLQKHVNFMTADSLKGRFAGSQGELAVARYIYDQLQEAGVTMLVPRDGEDFYIAGKAGVAYEGNIVRKDTIHSRNVIGIVEGYDPLLRNEYVVIGAHIDHLGINRIVVDGKESMQIYSGADDNASGVAALLEIAREVAANKFMFRRSVIFAFFGAEEVGMAGSWYFLNRSFSEVGNIVMMLNLDMIGRSGAGNEFRIFTGVRTPSLSNIVNELALRPASITPQLASTDYFPSDHRLFAERGIPIALFTTGTHKDYHTPRDLQRYLDFTQMEKIAEFAYALAQSVANLDERLKTVGTNPEPIDGVKAEKGFYTQNEVDKRATFLGGNEFYFLEKWVYPYIKYPDIAVATGESGRVVVEFIVEPDGKVTNVVIAKGVSEEIDAEAVKVVSASPKWKPAILGGSKVSVKIAIAIEFKLSDKAEFKLKK